MPTGFRSVLFPLGLKAAPSVPGAPGSLTAAATSGQVVLTWTAATANPSAPVTAYNVYRGTASGGETLLTTLGVVLTYTDTAVVGGATYYYKVSATNFVGEGPLSSEASARLPLAAMTGGSTVTHYAVLLYDGSLRFLARLPVMSVDAGQVVNDVAVATVGVVPRRGLVTDDITAFCVMRHEAGRVTQVGVYLVTTITTTRDRGRTWWVIQGATPLALYQYRLSPNYSSGLSGPSTMLMRELMDIIWRWGDYNYTAEATRIDAASPLSAANPGVLEPLSTIKTKAAGAEVNYGMDLRIKVNFDLIAIETANGLLLRPVAWTGEYGADRRIGLGTNNPVLLFLTKEASGWKAVDARDKQVTRIVGTQSAGTYLNSQALENPIGNRYEKTMAASSAAADRTNAKNRAQLYAGRRITRIQAELVLPPDRYGLALGDVFTVNVDGALGTAWLNVIHYAWKPGQEQVVGRIDVEVNKWN